MADNRDGVKRDFIFERRRLVRIEAHFIGYYKEIFEDKLKSDVSQTKNISEGGLLFTTDRQFEKGTMLEVKLRLPDMTDFCVVNVQVMDSRPLAKNLVFDTRVSFINLNEEVKSAIRKIVDFTLRNQQKH